MLVGVGAGANGFSQRGADGQPQPPRTSPGAWLANLAAGLGFTLGTHPTPTSLGATALQGWITCRLFDAQGNPAGQRSDYLFGSGKWEYLQTGVRVAQDGTLEVSAGTTGVGEGIYFDNLRVEQTGGLLVQEQHQYAYGAPLPGLSYTVGNRRYRHGYQGQYAEHDSITGFDSFELRLYNSRIGRWMSNDPEGQYNSPYIGMGNNPVSGIDPNGGFCEGCLSSTLGEVVVKGASQGGSRFLLPRIAQLITPGLASSLPRILTPIFRAQSLIPKEGFSSVKERDGVLKTLYGERQAWYDKNARRPGDAFYHEPGLESVYPEQYIIPVFEGLRAISLARTAAKVTLAEAVTENIPQVTANRIAGNLYRDELADALRQSGKQVETEVYKKTPFGKRFIDIEVSENGTVQGGIETKVGGSRYTSAQRAKDMYLERVHGYKVYVLRKPKIW